MREHRERGGSPQPRDGQRLRQQGRYGHQGPRGRLHDGGRGHGRRRGEGLAGRRLRQRHPVAGRPAGQRQRQHRGRRGDRQPRLREPLREHVEHPLHPARHAPAEHPSGALRAPGPASGALGAGARAVRGRAPADGHARAHRRRRHPHGRRRRRRVPDRRRGPVPALPPRRVALIGHRRTAGRPRGTRPTGPSRPSSGRIRVRPGCPGGTPRGTPRRRRSPRSTTA
ncbi:hypothetical protein SGPA1_10212 [Streptomyces misionensis JCM 4497]